MAYDSDAHRKLDELTEKVDNLEKLLKRLAEGLDVSSKPQPNHGDQKLLPRAVKSDRKPYGF